MEGRGEEGGFVASVVLSSRWGSPYLSAWGGAGGEVWSRGCWAFELTGPSLSSSQSDIGFGKLETYVKLDKLGEVRGWVWSSRGSQQESQGLPPPS